MQGSGVIYSNDFLGCIALGGYFETRERALFSLLTHRSSNDSENNLIRFDLLIKKIHAQNDITRGRIFIFHLDFSETVGATFIRNPYEQHFNSTYKLLVHRLHYFLSSYCYPVSLVPYSLRSEFSEDKSGLVFIDTKNKKFGTNVITLAIKAVPKSEVADALPIQPKL